MPEYLAPGVYVEETSFRNKSIEGVSTTTTGFIGPTRYGPVDLPPDLLTSLLDFERVYGDRQPLEFSPHEMTPNYLWHAVRAFFEEGGKRLYVVRTFRPGHGDNNGYAEADHPSSGGAGALRFRARFPGTAGIMRIRLALRLGQDLLSQD